jgi:hypothetical protein
MEQRPRRDRQPPQAGWVIPLSPSPPEGRSSFGSEAFDKIYVCRKFILQTGGTKICLKYYITL